MGRVRTLVGALTVGALLCLGISGARAQDEGARARARDLYAQAQRLFDQGQFAAAEQHFRQAYEAVPNPLVLRAIAASQERQGNMSGAVETLQLYLREAPNAQDRAEVEAHIRELTRTTAGRPSVLQVSTTPPGAQIIVDGQATAQRTPANVQLTAGEHTLELRLPGHRTVIQRLTVQAGTNARLEVPMRPGTGQDVFGVGGDGQDATGDDSGGGSADPSVGVWVAAGVGAAALISGTVFGFLALSEESSFDANPTQETADRGTTFALVADISFGVAAAAAITAVVLYIVERSTGGESSSASLNGEQLRLDVAPWAAPNGGGVAAQLRF